MKIYNKLYFSFLIIFLIGLFVVLTLSNWLYARRIRDEVQGFFVSQAHFMERQYEDSCAAGNNTENCSKFFANLELMPQVHLWILDAQGHIVASREKAPPPVTQDEIRRALNGEDVSLFKRRISTRAVIGINHGQVLVLERTFLAGTEFPNVQLLISLIVALILVALLVWPLSLRFTRPLRHLHQLGQEWAEGRLSKRAAIRGSDEISELSNVFNLMAENVQKMLEARKEFLALISHELKSPLARLQIASQLLLESENAPDRKVILTGMQTDLEESERLIDQLLQLSRVEMSAMMPQSIEVRELMKRIVDQMQPIASVANVQLESDAPSDVSILADRMHMERMLVNLIDNAIKYSPSGGSVKLSARSENGKVAMEVADHGPGIPEQEREKVFEPFYRGQTTADKSGTGLGLFLAKRIAELNHGSIRALPNEPSGTIIKLALPAASSALNNQRN